MKPRSKSFQIFFLPLAALAIGLIGIPYAHGQTDTGAAASPGDAGTSGTPSGGNAGTNGTPAGGDSGQAASPDGPDTGDATTAKADPLIDRPAIQAQYAAIDAAFVKQDVDTLLDDTHDQDFQAFDKNGKTMDLSGVHDALTDLFDKAKTAKQATRVRTVTFKNNTATVEIRRHVELSLVDPKTGENSQLTLDNYSRDFWTKDSDRWTEKRSRLLTSVRHASGKPPALLVTTW